MEQRSVRNWIFQAFTKQALLSLLVVELALLIAFYAATHFVQTKNTEYFKSLSGQFMRELTTEYANHLQQEINSISVVLNSYANASQTVLTKEYFHADPREKQRRKVFPTGVYATVLDNGGAASFYSAATPLKDQRHDKAWRLAELDTLMRTIVSEHPLISQIYVNTSDHYTHIYPYFDTVTQFASTIEVTEFNFYYLADTSYNPQHETVWTPIYLDPAGQGWMMSLIHPILDAHESVIAVAGVDITVNTLFSYLRDRDMPWNAKLYLVNSQQEILVSTNESSSLTPDTYSKLVRNQEQQLSNVSTHPVLKYAQDMKSVSSGYTEIVNENSESSFVTWEEIPSVNWKVITVVEESDLLLSTANLEADLFRLLHIMLAGLLLFYVAYFIFIRRYANKYGGVLSGAMTQLNQQGDDLARGNYVCIEEPFTIEEIDNTRRVYNTLSRRLERTINELSERERFVRYAMSASGNMAFQVDFNNGMIAIDTQLSFLLGLKDDRELPLLTMKNLIGPSQYELCKNELIKSQRQKRVFSLDLTLCLGERPIVLWVSGQFISTHVFTGTVADITEKKQLEESLATAKQRAEELTRARSTLMSSITHELRTPLTSLIGFTELLNETDLNGEQRELLTQIELANRHFKSIIDDLIVTSSVYANTLRLDIEESDLKGVLIEAIEFVEPLREFKKIKLQRILGTGCLAHFDVQRLKYAVIQILTNSIRYNEVGHDVVVLLECVDDEAVITIRDNGHGIAEGMLARATEPFSRAGREKLDIIGLGVGLSVSKELIEKMGGQLLIESEQSVGTKVQIILQRSVRGAVTKGSKYD